MDHFEVINRSGQSLPMAGRVPVAICEWAHQTVGDLVTVNTIRPRTAADWLEHASVGEASHMYAHQHLYSVK